MLVNLSMNASLARSLQLLVLSAASLTLVGVSAAYAQAPSAAGAPASTAPAGSSPTSPASTAAGASPSATASAPSSAPASSPAPDSATAAPVAPATPSTAPAQVMPASQASTTAPVKNIGRPGSKPPKNVYNGTNASTLEFPNVSPVSKKNIESVTPWNHPLPTDPWKLAAITETNPSYTVDVKYPQFDPVKGSDPSKLNEEIKRYVTAQVDAARSTMPAKMAHIEGSKPRSYINGICEVSFYNEQLCSLTVDLTSYVFQSAHPIEILTTFNYRMDKNQQYAVKEVFRPEFKHIAALSKMCISTLTEGLDDEGSDWVRRGAAPDEKNFQKFQITDKALVIVFDPYTVDNGADGYKSVPIVWDRLRANISTDAPFHKLVAR